MAAYTNNNQTILLNTLISEFVVIDSPFAPKAPEPPPDSNSIESVQGLCLLDSNLVIYGQYTWAVHNMAGKELSRKKILRESPILMLKMLTLEDYTVIYWSGDDANPDMSLETMK